MDEANWLRRTAKLIGAIAPPLILSPSPTPPLQMYLSHSFFKLVLFLYVSVVNLLPLTLESESRPEIG
jgi:hypothetical protein